MFGFGKKKQRQTEAEDALKDASLDPQPSPAPVAEPLIVDLQGDGQPSIEHKRTENPSDAAPDQGRLGDAIARAAAKREEETSQQRRLFAGLKSGLARTRAVLNADIGDLVSGRTEIDEDLLEELEMLLLAADVGVPATRRIIDDLAYRVKRREALEPDAFLAALRRELASLLVASQAPVKQPTAGRPQVILMVGVNGAGKTTTIGKLARQLKDEGNSVMLAAGDTFRAAAVEQLQSWGERNQVPVIAQHTGADPASVIFDALQAATARGIDVLIADTAGRLHTKSNLMEELRKIARVLKKLDADAPHEVMLVVDATAGQNALQQAVQFNDTLPLTGITLTKLDGTAKGGIIFAIAERLPVPFRFIGVGEQVEDLRPFEAETFLDALLSP
ncbi:signal recognition particle-docking protein FtsY [Halochromatium salexigens]|uniref:Signal recognition particle receptor FtsY n=1 Tax=Halochromatium salexigens TaxID=49447 RepID=A0AAJ0UGJ4_HALSE|nr:signal recognition particle-docking protein FtsY [Halochromatium salexigens]MBK5931047.1 signal recognition particle-docking protein FtsY [Halochromatium salexigens]